MARSVSGTNRCLAGNKCLSTAYEDWLLRGDGHGRPAARDQALRPQAAARSGAASEAERAPEPRGRVEADARLRAGRLRQDDAAGRVAGSRAGRRTVRGVALARPERQPSRVLLDLPDRRAADGGARGRRGRALAPAVASAADRSGPRHAAQRARRHPGRRRAGARRLPRHRRSRRPGRDGVPARPSAPTAAPGDRQPRRPGAAAGPPASARRARRDPRRRPALHARRGRGVPQRGDGPGADGAGRRSAGGAHRRVDRRAPAGGALDAGARRRRRLHRRLRGGRPLHRRLPGRGGLAASARPCPAASCCRPPSWTG